MLRLDHSCLETVYVYESGEYVYNIEASRWHHWWPSGHNTGKEWELSMMRLAVVYCGVLRIDDWQPPPTDMAHAPVEHACASRMTLSTIWAGQLIGCKQLDRRLPSRGFTFQLQSRLCAGQGVGCSPW